MIPSLWFENSPLVAYQAKQLGLPILASRIGGIPELVREGVNGQLLPLGDTARWQKAVRNLLAQPENLERLRAGAKEDAHPATRMCWEMKWCVSSGGPSAR